MNNEIPLKYYDIVDEYSTEAATFVNESERDALEHYFQLLITRLIIMKRSVSKLSTKWRVRPISTSSALMR